MSKRTKVLVSVLVAVLLLVAGGTASVMAQDEEPTLTPEPSTKIFMVTANTTGLLARVAKILDIPEEDLVNAFKQAQQEMREEAFIRSLDRAVEKGRLAQEEADQIEEWWRQKPGILDRSLIGRNFGFMAPWGRHMRDGYKGWYWPRLPGSADNVTQS